MTADVPCIPHSLCMTAKTAGVVSPTHSLKFTFSVVEEELLAVVCLLHARQGTPKMIPDFVSLATKFAEKKKDEKFSHCFEHIFIKRHSSALCLKTGFLHHPHVALKQCNRKQKKLQCHLIACSVACHQQKQPRCF